MQLRMCKITTDKSHVTHSTFMKTIGLIGGMSWESTQLYYQHINRGIAQRRGGLASAELVMVSVDLDAVAAKQRAGAWDELAVTLASAAQRLQRAGADCVLICTNTMHKVAPHVQSAVSIPLLHIAEPTCASIRASGLTHVGLLGTRFTMEQAFLRDHYAALGVQCIVPVEDERVSTHRIIFEELCKGEVRSASTSELQRIAQGLVQQGAQGIVLGCTELTLSLKPSEVSVPVFDTTALHAQAAVDFALS
jgi:aspartate racemase